LQTDVKESGQVYKHQNTAVELKGSVFTLPILQLRSTSIQEVEYELSKRLTKALQFFQNAPVVIDLQALHKTEDELDFSALLRVLSKQALIPVGVRNGTSQQNALAVSSGLAVLKGGAAQDIPEVTAVAGQGVQKPREEKPEKPIPTLVQSAKTKVINSPVRSGQQIYATNADLIVTAPVNPGAEIIADGNIHVYAPMRGRALAGVRGDGNARIFCQHMEAELVAIAGNFRVFEESVPVNIKSQAVQIFLDGEHLVISPLK